MDPIQTRFQNLNDQIIKSYTRLRRRHWNQTVTGHTGDGIHFNQPRLVVFIDYEINPPQPLAPRDENASNINSPSRTSVGESRPQGQI